MPQTETKILSLTFAFLHFQCCLFESVLILYQQRMLNKWLDVLIDLQKQRNKTCLGLYNNRSHELLVSAMKIRPEHYV